METKQEKKAIYEGLVELTKQSDPEVYFSRMKVLEHLKAKIQKETGAAIHYRSGYILNYKNGNFDNTKIDLDDVLPKKKNLPLALEEFVNEGKAKKIMTIDQRRSDNPPYTFDDTNTFYYRANL